MKKLLCILAVVVPFLMTMAAPPAGAQGSQIAPGVWRIQGEDPTLDDMRDLEPLRRMVGKATVVGLGEAFHTSGGFYQMKHRVFRYLVERMGFRVFTIESHWLHGERANRYVQSCAGTPKDAIATHISVWVSEELGDLVTWMCEWNQEHPNDRVHYYGFDIQEPGIDGPNLIVFLQRIGILVNHPWVAGVQQCQGVTVFHPYEAIPPDTHAQCMAALEAIGAHFQQNGAEIETRTSRSDFETAKIQLLGLKAWQEQAFLIERDFARGFEKRDEAMAKVFLYLRERDFPNAKAVVWAANMHVSKARMPNTGLPMGAHLAAALGRKYVNFAIAAWESGVDYGLCDTYMGVPGSVEERLHDLGEDALLMDFSKSNRLRRRGVYEMGSLRFRPRLDFNGILFLEKSERMMPLLWNPCEDGFGNGVPFPLED
jgi:erythromycin esterase-like protein